MKNLCVWKLKLKSGNGFAIVQEMNNDSIWSNVILKSIKG